MSKERDAHGRFLPGSGGWEEGESGNLKGRPPKDWTFTDAIRKVGDALTEEGQSFREALAKKVWELALAGNERMIALIYNRTDGLPIARVQEVEEVKVDWVDDYRPRLENDTKQAS